MTHAKCRGPGVRSPSSRRRFGRFYLHPSNTGWLRDLTGATIERFVQLLLVRDIHVVLSALEALHQMAAWPDTCKRIARTQNCVSTLVALLDFHLDWYNDDDAGESVVGVSARQDPGEELYDSMKLNAESFLLTELEPTDERADVVPRARVYAQYKVGPLHALVLSR